MSEFNVCIACLTSDIKMYSIRNTQLSEIYEKFANIRLCVGIPETICFICYSRLQKCYEFINMSQKAGKILTQLFHSGIQISQETLSPLDERRITLVTTILKPTSVSSSNGDRFLGDSSDYDVKTDITESSKYEIIDATDKADIMTEAQVTITLKEEPRETGEQIAEAIKEEFVCVKEEPIDRDEEFNMKQEYNIEILPVKEEKTNVKNEKDIMNEDLNSAIQFHINIEIDSPGQKVTSERNDNNLLKVGKYTKQSYKKEKSHACTRCDLKFSGLGFLIRHMRVHTGEKPFACLCCDKKFSQSGHLTQHMRSHTGEKPYICNTCNKAFNRKNNLITHVKKHSELTFHLCNICNKVLSNKGVLKRHMLVHTGEKPYVCQSCGKTFSQKGHLIQHMRLHTGEKPHTCNSCNLSFYRKGPLNKHMLTHTQDYPHQCTICDRRFPTQNKLKRHMSIHTEQFVCKTCNEAFHLEENYKTHMENHVEVICHKCNVCNKNLSSKEDLEKHMMKHIRIQTQENSYACNFWEKSFIQDCDLINHTGEKPFSCDECHKTFSSKAILANHMRLHSGEKPYASDKCEQTHKKDYLKNHDVTHSYDHNNLQQHSLSINSEETICVKNEHNEVLVENTESISALSIQKPYVCNYCNKAYNRKNNLQRHKKIHIRRNDEFIIP